MSDTEPTNPQGEVALNTLTQEVTNDQSQGDDETQPRDDKGRFTGKADAEPEIDPAALEALVNDQSDEEEFEEVEIDGDRLAVPKSKAQKIREAILRHADYTRKTQEVAQQRKQIEEAFAQQKQEAESQKADFEEYAALHALGKYLEQFKTVDWSDAMDKDPIAAQKQFIEWQRLNADLQERQGRLNQKQQERALLAQRETARREEEGRNVLRQTIRDWSPQTEANLKAFAKERGVPNADQLQFAMHPQETQILYEAYQYRQLLKKAQAKPKTTDPKPVNTVGKSGRSTPQGLSDDLATEEWAKRFRERQLRKQ